MTTDDSSPAERYAVFRSFDPCSFDSDLERFPGCFDFYGWPLFGEYDRYALAHPITGLSWHLAPRVPEIEEPDGDYDDWFGLATDFQWIRSQLGGLGKPATSLSDDQPLAGVSYRTASRNAAVGNLAYLRQTVLPALELLIEKRKASVRLASSWGEFRWLAESLSITIPASRNRQRSIELGRKHNKDAQLKWYLHWRRFHCDGKGLSPRRANTLLSRLLVDISRDKIVSPDGFSKDWFQQCMYQPRVDQNDHVVAGPKARSSGLSELFLRSGKDKRATRLLASDPEDDPRIPPLDPNAFLRAQ